MFVPRAVGQHRCPEKSLRQSVMQFLLDPHFMPPNDDADLAQDARSQIAASKLPEVASVMFKSCSSCFGEDFLSTGGWDSQRCLRVPRASNLARRRWTRSDRGGWCCRA